jgi:hypothetical protein
LPHGHSRIVDPKGTIVSEIEEEEGGVAEVDLHEEITRARTESFFGLNLLQDRRPEHYKIISDTDVYYRGGVQYSLDEPVEKSMGAKL